MRRMFGVSAVALLLAGCGGPDSEGTFETADGGEGTYAVDSDGNETTIDIMGDDGERVTINNGANLDAALPDGYSIYPGAEIITSTTISQADGQGVMILMQSGDSPQDLVEFYRRQAEAAGVEIQMDANINGSSMIGGETGDGGTFSFNASPTDEGSSGQLIVGQGLSG